MAAGNKNLNSAKTARKDEFYTQLTDIEKEMRYYRKHFMDKTVLCNCDDPFESNFFKYFVLNFNRLGLKKLMRHVTRGRRLPISSFPYLISSASRRRHRTSHTKRSLLLSMTRPATAAWICWTWRSCSSRGKMNSQN